MTPRALPVVATAVTIAAIAAGTLVDRPTPSAARTMGGYHVLAGDFHVHSFPQTWSLLSPIDTVLEARHRGLDVIAMTPHDSVWAGKLGAWFSREIGGPVVIVGQEITARRYHLIGLDLRKAIPSGLPLDESISRVHAQNGVAIIAHPYRMDWLSAGAPELRALNGAEIVRPEALAHSEAADRLDEFFARGTFTAIGSSDFHGLGPMGYARTWVFARERTAQGVMEALREGRTITYGRSRTYGDPALAALAEQNGGLPHDVPPVPLPGGLGWFSRIGILAALSAMLLLNRW